jgi:hypothetical protein
MNSSVHWRYHELNVQERTSILKAKINQAWDDPPPSRPVSDVFAHIEAIHVDTVAAQAKPGG